MTTIVPVVEGAGDVSALPELLGRILLERYNRPDVIVAQGKSMVVVTANGRQNLGKQAGEISSNTLKYKPECDAILVLLDTDGDCPVATSPGAFATLRANGLDPPGGDSMRS